MSNTMSSATTATARSDAGQDLDRPRRLTTETKAAFKTTELIAYLAAVLGVLIASAMVSGEGKVEDFFRADRAWFYVVLLTIGYMVSRGLAKSGSRDAYDA